MSPDANWLIWSSFARDVATAATFLVFLVGGIFGLFRYLRTERVRKTEQVRELFHMFFESERYRRIRFILEAPASAEFAQLKAEVGVGGLPTDLVGHFIDLLNFFEFASGLTRRGLVARADVDWMFANFIQRLGRIDFVRDYVLKNEFEELGVLLRPHWRK